MGQKIIIGLLMAVVVSILMMEPAMASPGGKIASAVFESFWGKVALVCLIILFSPLLIMNAIKLKLAERRTRKDLRFMAGHSAKFDMLKLLERAKDCFMRVHAGWDNEDLSEASQWMTDWYWQNQQSVYLDKWREQGLVNVCNVKKIKNVRPILFVHRNQGEEHEDSMVVLSITAEMQDYLQHRVTGEIVEGSKTFKDVSSLWSFTLEAGVWKVSDINEAGMTMSFARLTKELPKIETTVVSDLRA